MALVETTQFFVWVAGTDVSTRFASRLIRLKVDDNSGETADTASIELDDTAGSLGMPEKGAAVKIALGPQGSAVAVVFDGIVTDVKSIYDRGSGRRLQIDASSADTTNTKTKSKKKRRKHHDNKTVGEAVKDAGKYAGVQVEVAPRIAQLKRVYQCQDNESFLHYCQRMAREYGGTFKTIGGNRAVILDRNEGKTAGASGGAIGNVTARVGDNLITANISPIMSRPRYQKIKAVWYDTKEAKWKDEQVFVPGGEDGDVAEIRHSRDDKPHAKDAADGTAKEADRNKGAGSVKIDGNPMARAEGTCTVVGVRPGVDGSYTIEKASHELDRGSGYVTDIELRRPDAKADARGKKGGGAKGGTGGGGGGGATPDEQIFG